MMEAASDDESDADSGMLQLRAVCHTSASKVLSELLPGLKFSVGGSLPPYLGHWGLPAGQRINCRCTTISVLSV